MKVMAIDYGDARTGIAISDALGMICGFSTVIHDRREAVVAAEIAVLCKTHNVGHLVLGLPKNMNDSEGPRAEKSRTFGAELTALTALPLTFWDERRTTVDAHRILSDVNKRGKKRKDTVDAVAASLILEGYLRRQELGV